MDSPLPNSVDSNVHTVTLLLLVCENDTSPMLFYETACAK